MNNYLDGFDRKEVTLKSLQDVSKGKTVIITKNFTTDVAKDGNIFAGVCTHAENQSATIQLRGYVHVPFTGTAPACGYVKLSANGTGGVKADTNGRYVLVTDIDTYENTCGIIL